VETSFRDLSHTLKIEQWLSKSLNGVLQELYAGLWAFNHTKIILVLSDVKCRHRKVPMNYRLANFKVLLSFISKNLKDFVMKCWSRLKRRIEELIRRATETRTRRSRSNPRRSRSAPKAQPVESTLERRRLTERY